MYGDSGYALSGRLARPFTVGDSQIDGESRVEEACRINRAMASVRVTVEWGFADIKNGFNFLQNFASLRVNLFAPGQVFLFCTFMQNIRSCIQGTNRVASYFNLRCPTLDEYLPLSD